MRKSKRKIFVRTIALFIAVLFAGTVCAACAGSGGNTPDSGPDQQTAAGGMDENGTAGKPEDPADAAAGDGKGSNTAAEDTAAGAGSDAAADGETEIQVFIAASLQTVMTQLAEDYKKDHPDIKITYHADSSGTLLTQIQEGYACDIFFSAAQKQMDQLEADGLMVEGTRADVVNNQVVVVARKDSSTKVTGLSDIGNAENIALAGGSVPVGRYTRAALMKLGLLEEAEDAAAVTTQQVSDALGGVEISEQDNVSKVLLAVVEGSCEVGTVYDSDTYGYEDDLEILETVSYDLTGDVVYPAAQVVNTEAGEAQTQAAAEFLAYILSDEAKAVFEKYYYDPVK